MLVERLYQLLQALPDRVAEQALVFFRGCAEAWDTCINIVSAQGTMPDTLTLFAAQTLHACARRTPLPDGETGETAALTLVSRQQALLVTLVHLAGQGGQTINLICAALAALSVRHCSSLRDVLSAALQQLPQCLAVQLLLAVAEEGEALQARAGSEVERCAAVHHDLREEVGPHVFTWLAVVAATAAAHYHPDNNDSNSHQSNRHNQQRPFALQSLLVRCFAAWCRLGCLYGTRCPVGAVREMLQLLLRWAHPGHTFAASYGTVGGGAGDWDGGVAPAILRSEACEALGDIIEHGPDTLLRELQEPMVHLAAAVAAAAVAERRDAGAGYDIAQLVSSYAAGRLGELVAAVCSDGGGSRDSGGAGTTAATATVVAPLVEALCQLAALPVVTAEGSYPISWPAMQTLTDLALGCIAAAPPPPPSGTLARPTSADTVGPQIAPDGDPPWVPSSDEHCVPDITLGPRPGLPPHLIALYDNVLRGVLSCCVSWSLLDAVGAVEGSCGGAHVSTSPALALGRKAEVYSATAAVGLLALPPGCEEALRGCLQACGGIMGQVRQIQIATELLQYTASASPAASASMVADGRFAGGTGESSPSSSCSQVPARTAMVAAALTTALAAISACGTLPPPAVAIAGANPHGGGAASTAAATAAASAAGRILLTAADYLHREYTVVHFPPAGTSSSISPAVAAAARPPLAPLSGLAVPLTLYYCEAFAASCQAVLLQLQLQQQVEGMLQLAGQGPLQPLGSSICPMVQKTQGASWVLCRLVEPAFAGIKLKETAGVAARALHAFVSAARRAGIALPLQLAAALVDSTHCLPYDVGPSFRAAEREVVQAAVAAAAAAGGEQERHELLHRLLSPAVSHINRTAAKVASTSPRLAASASYIRPHAPASPPLPSYLTFGMAASADGSNCTAVVRAVISAATDQGLVRQLRLLEAALTAAVANANVNAASQATVVAAVQPADRSVATVFVKEAWPALQVLLQRGAAGQFLLPLCRCLAAVLRSAGSGELAVAAVGVWQGECSGGAGASTGGSAAFSGMRCGLALHGAAPPAPPPAQPDGPDPWVSSALEALAACVGRPGAKHMYEPLAAILEACAGAAADRNPGSSPCSPLKEEEEERLRRWQQRHAAPVACTVYSIVCGSVASELAASWRAADRDPDSAECILRLATAAVRYDILEPSVAAARTRGRSGGGGGNAGPTDMDTAVTDASVAGVATQECTTSADRAAEVATAALRLAAASSGCDHRQVSAAALACTCAVLEAARGYRQPCGSAGIAEVTSAVAVAAGTRPNACTASGGYQIAARPELLAVVMQQGPVVTAGLLATLLSSSPLPRLQRVATALVLLSAVVARCYRWEQQLRQFQHHQHQQYLGEGAEACRGVLASWLLAAAEFLQLPKQDGAALISSWLPLLVEAGVSSEAAAKSVSDAAVPTIARITAAPEADMGTEWSAGCSGGSFGESGAVEEEAVARGLGRRLRRLLRGFAESRLCTQADSETGEKRLSPCLE